MLRHARLIAVGLMIALLVTALKLTGLWAHFSLEALREQLAAHQMEGFALFTLLFCLGNLAQVPGWIFLAAAVLALGQLAGGVTTYFAASISCLIVFLVVRLIGGNALRKLENSVARRILAQIDRHPVASVTLLRMVFQTMPPLNYSLALSGIALRPYLIGTLLGLPIPIALYALFFDTLTHWLQLP